MNQSKRDIGILPAEEIATLQQAYRAGMPLPAALEPSLRGVMEDGLIHFGGMSRARLANGCWTALGGDLRGHQLATALEYFQSASLMLDDLPCMDDAQLRRGRVCPHLRFGEASTILGAVAFINRGHLLLGQVMADAPASARMQALRMLDRCLGLEGLLNGQALDLNARRDMTPVEVALIAGGKTTPLFELALALPALILEAEPKRVRALRRLALVWGLAYQLLDDLKDLDTTSAASGKTTGRDESLGRPNWVRAAGRPRATRRLRQLIALSDRLIHQIAGQDPAWAFLREFGESFRKGAAHLLPKAA